MITGNLNFVPDSRVRCIFYKVLNIDFPLILISLNVVERSLLLKMTSVFVVENDKIINLMP